MALNRAGTHIYESQRWRRLRYVVLRRDGFRCVACGAGDALEIDHVKPIRTNPELAWSVRNLQTLCISCHTTKTNEEMGRRPIPGRARWTDLLKGNCNA